MINCNLCFPRPWTISWYNIWLFANIITFCLVSLINGKVAKANRDIITTDIPCVSFRLELPPRDWRLRTASIDDVGSGKAYDRKCLNCWQLIDVCLQTLPQCMLVLKSGYKLLNWITAIVLCINLLTKFLIFTKLNNYLLEQNICIVSTPQCHSQHMTVSYSLPHLTSKYQKYLQQV